MAIADKKIDTSQNSKINFQATINDELVRLNVSLDSSLLDILRDDLGLTGAKRGCDIGACGSCAVIVNGKALDACIISAKDAIGKEIETIEGVEKNGNLHPLQEAFIETHGFQCGICTSGFIMSAKALLDKEPKPTIPQIKKAIHKNICRCTGYEQLMESVLLASGQLTAKDLEKGNLKIVRSIDDESPDGKWHGRELQVIGHSKPRIESRSRVTGEALYTADIAVEGMAHGATVWSEHVHAKIISIDTSEAESLPGVLKVFTHKDITGENAYGKRLRDQQVFCDKKVRYIGDAIALVVAEERKTAFEAAKLVKVKYETIPSVTDVEAAIKNDAPKVHEENENGNILSHYHLEKGDIEKGFEEADVIIERKYTTQPQDHTPIEPEAAIAYFDDDTGKLTVYSPGQSVFYDRLNIIRALGIPKEDVRCIQPAIGAAYGKREDIYAQIHVALAVMALQRPVRIEWTREETILSTAKRTRQVTEIKIGVKNNGKITAYEARILGDVGAYASWSVNIMRKAGVLLTGPYEIDNIKVDSYAVYTNTPFTGATRGFGAAETNFCGESILDEAAEAIGMDQLEFRKLNALNKNGKTSTNYVWDRFAPLEATLEEAAKDFGWEERKAAVPETDSPVKTGVGVAGMWYGIGFGTGIPDTTDVIAELNKDGTLTIFVGTVDYGNGSNTIFAMMAAETLGLTLDEIIVVNGDTDRTKNCGSTVASKQTYTTGNAVVRACHPIMEDILSIAASISDKNKEDLEIGNGIITDKTDSSFSMPFNEAADRFDEFGKPRRREGIFKAGELTAPLDPKTGQGKAWYPMAFGAQMAAVEVNTKTGKVVVKDITACHYAGRALNPRAVRGQIVGGISMGVGFALYEDPDYKDGIPQSTNFDKYKLMRSKNYPNISCVVLEHDESTAPFGGIGIGEPPTIPTAAAIANAVYDAIGVRMRDLPITPDKVLKALEKNNADTG